MVEQLMIYEPGDRLATMSAEGRAVVWQVQHNGLLKITRGQPAVPDSMIIWQDPEDDYDSEDEEDHD